MAEPFKNLLGPQVVADMASRLHGADTGFPAKRFRSLALDGLDAVLGVASEPDDGVRKYVSDTNFRFCYRPRMNSRSRSASVSSNHVGRP